MQRHAKMSIVDDENSHQQNKHNTSHNAHVESLYQRRQRPATMTTHNNNNHYLSFSTSTNSLKDYPCSETSATRDGHGVCSRLLQLYDSCKVGVRPPCGHGSLHAFTSAVAKLIPNDTTQ